MTNRTRVPLRIAAVSAAALAGLVSLAPAASAAEGDVEVTNTETVQVYTDATGKVETRRVYEQLALTGDGEVELSNPIETDGLRNLDEFGGYEVEDGQQIAKMTVDGEERLRSVSDYSGDLPLEVEVTYILDGEQVEPGEVVGESGELEVLYTVRNVTAQPQEVTYTDGSGGEVTETVDVPIPMVGSLTTTAPPTFTDVQSGQANLAGDGKGGTKLSFTMTLFPPLGSDTAEFGYTANITEGIIPRADISALPVNPLESPTFKTAADSYEGGSNTGEQLAAGASEIDANLLKLRDGSADLLAGLIQLQSGSAELAAGLNDEAAPGAARLADGAGELADGAGDAHAGSRELSDGLNQISGGLDQLAGKLPGANKGIKQLQAGVDQILAGFGNASTDGTLLNGLTRLEAGAQQIAGGLGQLRGDGSPATPGLVGAKGGVDQVKAGIDNGLAPGGGLDQLQGGLNAVKSNFCATHQTLPAQCSATVDQLLLGVAQSRSDLTTASGGLALVSGGLANAIGALDSKLIPGANDLAAGAGDAKDGAAQLKAGVKQIDGGLAQLSDGITDAVSGVLRLSDGAGDAAAGGSELSTGLGRLDDGAGQVADGAGELADGLGEAADGSHLLSQGLGQAADGAPQLVDGAQRLSDEGTKQLVKAGEATAQDYGQMYATIAAGAERADAENMAYGAPEGATGLTAYSFVVQGEDGEEGRNWTRALLGLALLGIGGAVFAVRRRVV